MQLIGWPGGKSRFVKQIVPFIESTPHEVYVEGFCGSAVITLAKKRSKVEIINDAHNELVNLFWVVKHKPAELTERMRLTLSSEYEYKRLTNFMPKNRVERAFKFVYLNKQAFANRNGDSWTPTTSGQSKYDPILFVNEIKKMHRRLVGVHITCRDYRELKTFDTPRALFYLDPPYLNTTTSGYADQDFNTEVFALWCNHLKCKAIISHNYDPNFIKLFPDWHVEIIGDRANSISGKVKKRTHAAEALFFNYLPTRRGRLL